MFYWDLVHDSIKPFIKTDTMMFYWDLVHDSMKPFIKTDRFGYITSQSYVVHLQQLYTVAFVRNNSCYMVPVISQRAFYGCIIKGVTVQTWPFTYTTL